MRYKSNDSLIGKEFKVLDKGFVQLVDYMGNDTKIVDAARVSYGKGTKTRHEDEGLIRYLMRHRHTTPFEQCSISLRVKVPMDCWRQWIRHRTASVNEYSTRYSEAIDDKQQTNPLDWRKQDNKINKQGSSGLYLDEIDGKDFSRQEKAFHDRAEEVYKMRIEKGVAREQARKDLPLSTYTLAIWTINLHNLLHFLSLRMDSHAQLEIRQYANIIGNEIVAKLFPLTWGAFQDYRLNAINLTARDINMIRQIDMCNDSIVIHTPGNKYKKTIETHEEKLEWLFTNNSCRWLEKRKDGTLMNNIERIEFEEKAKRLGIEVPWK